MFLLFTYCVPRSAKSFKNRDFQSVNAEVVHCIIVLCEKNYFLEADKDLLKTENWSELPQIMTIGMLEPRWEWLASSFTCLYCINICHWH